MNIICFHVKNNKCFIVRKYEYFHKFHFLYDRYSEFLEKGAVKRNNKI